VLRKILVPLDGSRFGEHALPWAMALARKLEAALELATVASPAPSPTPPRAQSDELPGEEARERGMGLAERYLRETAERIAAAAHGGEVGWSVIPPGNVAVSLVRHQRQVEADLAVLTTHGRGPLRRAWLGSQADGFIRRTPRPVLLVRPEEEGEEEGPVSLERLPEPFRRILLPLDGSAAGERLAELAPPLADANAAFLLLRVVQPALPGGSPYLPHLVQEAGDLDRIRQFAATYLEGVRERLRERVGEVEVRVVTGGQPAQAILETAEETGADLLAMSTSGRGGVSRLLLGSVADKVIRGSPCPVLLFREQEEGSD
jgi:nucleotide-binding universal stress UspA family protein